MTKPTDSSRRTDSGVSGDAQTRAREIRRLRLALRRIKELDKMPSRVEAATQMVELAKDALKSEFPSQPCTDEVASGVE